MSMRSRRWSGALAAIVLLVVVCVVPAVRTPILRAIGWALVVDEPLAAADVIVLPRWAGAAGAIDAADLVHNGMASRVALLPEPAQTADKELIRRGIPPVDQNADVVRLLRALGVADVDVIPDHAAGTAAEGRVLRSWFTEHQFRTIVVVSSPDHSRRVRRVLRRSMRGYPAKLMIRSARYASFDPDSWWMTREGARTEIVELEKLLLDLVLHPLS
jgi:hypothetical protein